MFASVKMDPWNFYVEGVYKLLDKIIDSDAKYVAYWALQQVCLK